jgi:hypothetical protein
MAAVTENDLKELKDLITAGFAKSDANQARLEASLNDLKIEMGKISEKVSGIDKRLDIIENRVNGLTGWLIGVLFILITGLLGLLGKVAFFPGTN